MPIPKVAIVGRPNVGKSSLLNWIARKMISVVDPTAGVTRDRVIQLIQEEDQYFELIDTGGIGIVDSDDLSVQIEEQIDYGIHEADLILFVVDGQAGVTPLDVEVAERLRPLDTPKILVVNKCDSTKVDQEIHEFHKLADSPIVVTSVIGNRNRKELITEILKQIPVVTEENVGEEELVADAELKFAVVGRRNAGKSTFINALAESERVIVSEIAGTTRDSIDVRFDVDGRTFIAIDTPGVRKRKSIANDIELYGLFRAKKSIRRANVVFMFFDARETISRVDKQLVSEIHEQDRPCIFVVNKWDLADDMTTEAWSDYLFESFSTMRHVPIAFITAQEGRNVRQLINLAQTIYKQARMRVSTSKLNRIVRAAMLNNMPPYRKNRRPKIFYVTQVSTEPPTIVVKCNDPKLFDVSWKRYLLGVLREELPFKEVPIRLYMRPRQRDEETEKSLDDPE